MRLHMPIVYVYVPLCLCVCVRVMGRACGRSLTADVGIHGSTAAAIEGADALAVITVPCADPATTAGREEKVTIPVVLDAGQGTVVTFEEDRSHGRADSAAFHER